MKKFLIFLIFVLETFLCYSQSNYLFNSKWSLECQNFVYQSPEFFYYTNPNHQLKLILKENHNITSFKVLVNYKDLCNNNTINYSINNLINTESTTQPDTFIYNLPTTSDGEYLYTFTPNNLNSLFSLRLRIVQNQTPVTWTDFNTDSLINYDATTNLRLVLPSINNTYKVQLYQYSGYNDLFPTLIYQKKYLNTINLPTETYYPISNPPGTYYYKMNLTESIDTCLGAGTQVLEIKFREPSQFKCAVDSVYFLNDQILKTRYRFNLNPNCNTYEARFYKILSTSEHPNIDLNPNLLSGIVKNLPLGPVTYRNAEIETLSSRRILLTQQEINQGYFERNASPMIRRHGWYRIDIVCTSCPYNTFKIKTIYKYIYP